MARRSGTPPSIPVSASSSREPVVGHVEVRELRVTVKDGKVTEHVVEGFRLELRRSKRKQQPWVKRKPVDSGRPKPNQPARGGRGRPPR